EMTVALRMTRRVGVSGWVAPIGSGSGPLFGRATRSPGAWAPKAVAVATIATDNSRTLRRQDIRRLRTVVKRSEERKRGADRSRSERSEDGKPAAGGRSPPVRKDGTPTT